VPAAVKRIAIVGHLKPGAQERANELLSQGPPFDLASGGFDRHIAFISDSEVVFVFEGDEVEWKLDDVVSDFFRAGLQQALGQWRELIDGEPKLAEQAYFWQAATP
jgi:hypothetical protein